MNTNTNTVEGSITTSIGSQGGSNDGDSAGSHVTSIGSQGGRNDGDNTVKRRMMGRVHNMNKIRTIRTMVSFLMTTVAVYVAKEYPSASLLPVIIKTSVPICLGVLVNSTVGLIVEGDMLEGLFFGLKAYMIILAILHRVEDYYVGVVFLLLCGGFFASSQLVRLASLFTTYIGAVEDLACSIMSSIDMLYGRQVPSFRCQRNCDGC